LQFFDRGGVIMQDTELVVGVALCLAGGDFHISMRNSYFEKTPRGRDFGVWPKKIIIILSLFEGGLLCAGN
jgi:hypothetical protein